MEKLKQQLTDFVSRLKIDEKRKKLRELEAEASKPGFWDDWQKAQKTMKELARTKELLEAVEMMEMYAAEGEERELQKELEKWEGKIFLSGPYDENDAIVSIHAGQGGVEAMDWAEMLFRMYSRFAELKRYKTEVLDESLGEEAGYKNVVFSLEGEYAYGLLKFEAGTHRLVRQSPFNADNLRQTSFALVEVLPVLEDDKSDKIFIKEEDLEWEFFRSGGHGGQNVNKLSTAVRVRHRPTGIVVGSQTQRQQGQNRENALKILRAKLWERKQQEEEKRERELKGEYKAASWGSQIRNYVLHPYKLIKDLRTGYETNEVQKVLDGDLDLFIKREIQQLTVVLPSHSERVANLS